MLNEPSNAELAVSKEFRDHYQTPAQGRTSLEAYLAKSGDNPWNASMLPEVAECFIESYTGEELADHYGAQKPSGAPDPTLPLRPATQSAK